MGEKFEWFVEASDMQDAIEWFSEAYDADGYKKQRPRSNYRVTVEEIEPPQEQPQWWFWEMREESWCGLMFKDIGHRPHAHVFGNGCHVWGTSLDRDAKRDALLAAAKAAGKDGE